MLGDIKLRVSGVSACSEGASLEDDIKSDIENLDYLASLGANLFANAQVVHNRPNSAARLQAVLSEGGFALKTKAGSCLGSSFNDTHVHRRYCRSPAPSPTVPSHCVVPHSKIPTADARQPFQATQNAMIKVQREKKERAAKIRQEQQAREFQRALARWDMISIMSVRQKLERGYVMERVAENMQWQLTEKPAVRSNVNVVVIGGGMAGLTATNKLISMGFTNVKLLEATNRLGGRIHSLRQSQHSTSLIELGVPAIDPIGVFNTVHTLATNAQLLFMDVHEPSTDREMILTSGRKVDSKLVSLLTQQCQILHKDIDIIYTLLTRETGAGVNLAYNDFIRAKYKHLTRELRVETENDEVKARQLLRALINHSKFRLGDSYGDLATQHIQLHKPLTMQKGNKVISLARGMSALIKPLTANFKAHTVQLNAQVCELRWGKKFQLEMKKGKVGANILVKCNNGEVLPADHVIMAVPLGHLKKNLDNLFNPPLPKAKRDVIKRLGYGTVSKVFLYFDDPIWSLPFHFTWAGTDNESDKLLACPVDVATLLFNINIVEFDMVGSAVENVPEVTVIDQLRIILERYHRAKVAPPVWMRRTNWFSNPLFCGTHPYLSTACTPEDMARAAEPVIRDDVPIILFAGDYTHRNYHCLIHSARASGAREALRLEFVYEKFFGANNSNP